MQGKSKARAPRIDEQTERKQIVVHAPCNCHDGFKASLIAGSLCQDQSTLFGSKWPFSAEFVCRKGPGKSSNPRCCHAPPRSLAEPKAVALPCLPLSCDRNNESYLVVFQ
jgi:hypothetical protein